MLRPITIRNCARCQGTHENVMFEKLVGEPIDGVEGDYTHWAMCPEKMQPIVLAVLPKDQGRDDNSGSDHE